MRSNFSKSTQIRNLRVRTRFKAPRPFPKCFLRERARGELDALAKLTALRFNEAFEEIGERKYRAKM